MACRRWCAWQRWLPCPMVGSVMVARLLGAPPAAPGQQLAGRAAAQAVARLWELLQDFCSLGVAPADWSAVVPVDHPVHGWNAGAASWQLVRVP